MGPKDRKEKVPFKEKEPQEAGKVKSTLEGPEKH